MAFTKKEKSQMMVQYQDWLNNSKAFFMLEYNHMNMKDVDALRAKIREAGGEAHVVKNTLMDMALKEVGIKHEQPLVRTTLVGFAFSDAPAVAKVFSDAVKTDIYKLKGGYLEKAYLSEQQVKDLADLPPLPVMRARILGMIMAPASAFVRTVAEPARQVAAVLKAYSEKEGSPEAAPTAG